jgi:hypothetical protein
MEEFKLTTPIAFIIFNRPDTTKKVFDVIRQAKPKQLFIIADGARKNKPGEDQKCIETRTITEQVDWDCEVFRNYAPKNLGCRNRVASGLDWVFNNVEEVIILEDDCLPHPSFFRFCQELLLKYKNDEKVMMVSGNNVLTDYEYGESSYYFSNYAHIWGWATWGRVWQNYDVEMKDWNQNNSKDFFSPHLPNKSTINFWRTLTNDVYNRKIDTWDVQLQYYFWKHNGLTIIPAKNLVVNLGFGLEATNTAGSGGLYEKMRKGSINFPLVHPKSVKPNIVADTLENKLYHKFGYKEKIRRYLLKIGIKIKPCVR